MVVIEQVPGATEEEYPGRKSESDKSAPATSDLKRSAYDSGVVSGNASDGYETADDNELNNDTDDDADKGDGKVINSTAATDKNIDNDDDNNGEKLHERHHEEQLPEDASQTLTLSAEELAQKTLAQANDAKLEGNKLFKDGLYEQALSQYALALQIVPEIPSSVEIRSICYANRAACFFKLRNYEDTIKECTNALKLNSTYVKALLRRGEAHEKLEHYEEAIADMTKILELEPSHDQARRTIVRLKPLADEKREKMKEEMIGKLKEMGNSVLGRFGMSIDNFKAVKDPNTGSYSISFQQ